MAYVLRPDYQTRGSLQHFASFPSAADDTEKHHSGTPPLQFLGKDKSGVVLQLRLLWQHRGASSGGENPPIPLLSLSTMPYY